MPSIQEVFSVSSPQEFTDYVTWCKFIVNNPCQDVAIVKATPRSNLAIHPSVKGLIFNPNSGEIIAPGVPLIQEATPTSLPVGFSMALDGIMFRIYRYKGKVHWSTSGMFNPDNGHWGASKTFGEMFKEVSDQVDFNNIKEGLCYFAILEHSDQPGVYRPTDNYAMLTLVRVTDLAGTSFPMETLSNFSDTFARVLEYRSRPPTEADLMFLGEEADSNPVQYDKYGVMVYYANGEVVRHLSKQAQKAVSLLPNLPNVWQHWIYCYRNGGLTWVNDYASMFPWKKDEFNRYTSAFLASSDTEKPMSNDNIKSLILKQPVPLSNPLSTPLEPVSTPLEPVSTPLEQPSLYARQNCTIS